MVRAEDPVDDPAQPRGKQDWRPAPHDIWYHRTTGIWQPVWIEVVGDLHLTRLDWTPDLVRGRVTLEAELSGAPVDGARLEVRLTRPDRVVAEASVRVGTTVAVGILDIPEARHGQEQGDLLWTPEQPNLLDARVSLVAPDGRVLDEVTSLPRVPQRRRRRRALPPQRPPLLPAARAGAGLLAAVTPGRTRRRRAPRGGGAGEVVGVQRDPHPPEDRGSALPLLVRPARAAGLGGDAQRIRVQPDRSAAFRSRSGPRRSVATAATRVSSPGYRSTRAGAYRRSPRTPPSATTPPRSTT